jgi:hypothetical protein
MRGWTKGDSSDANAVRNESHYNRYPRLDGARDRATNTPGSIGGSWQSKSVLVHANHD